MRYLLMALMLIAATAAPLLAHGGHDHNPTTSLKKIWPNAGKFSFATLKLEGATLKSIEKQVGKKLTEAELKQQAYVAMADGKPLGTAWKTSVKLGGGEAQVFVGLDNQGKVAGVVVEESRLAGFSKPEYLKQYNGKSASSKLKVGTDITAVPQQANASQALADAVRRAVIVLTETGK